MNRARPGVLSNHSMAIQRGAARERRVIRAAAIFDRARSEGLFEPIVPKWSYYRTPLKSVEKILQTPIKWEILSKVRSRKNPNEPVRVLDLGCGYGTALVELKKKMGRNIHTTGFTIEKNEEATYKGIDQLITKKIGKEHANRFDYIFSSFGTIYHTEALKAWLKRTHLLLREGGKAVLLLPENFWGELAFERFEKNSGFKEKMWDLIPDVHYHFLPQTSVSDRPVLIMEK